LDSRKDNKDLKVLFPRNKDELDVEVNLDKNC
jgi:hypothetical protein